MKSEIGILHGRKFLITRRRRRNEPACVVAQRFSAAAALVLSTCLLSGGGASNWGGKSSNQTGRRVTVLSESLEPLRQQFNAEQDKPRVLALLSPT